MKATVFAIVIALAGTAIADDSRATAERYFRAGAKAYAAQSFAAAAADFDEAYTALPLPEIAFSGAQAYRRLYRVEPRPEYVRRAVELYRVYLAKVKTGGRVGDAADSLGELERELDKLKAKGVSIESPGSAGARSDAERRGVSIDAKPAEHTRLGIDVSIAGQSSGSVTEIGDATSQSIAGLHATLDGKPVEPYALVDVTPGEHAVTVSADGYFSVDKKQHAVAGASALVEVTLEPKPATVAIATESGARISVDGRVASSTRLELAAGTHVLVVSHPGRVPFEKELAVTRGQTLSLAAPLATTTRRRAVPWLVTGAGALAVGAITTTILALVHDSDASSLRNSIATGNRPPSDGDAYDRQVHLRDDYKTAAYVMGGSAVIAGGIAAILYWFDEPTPEGIHIAPIATPAGAGLAANGRF
jgi:hypothetical protein